jgi:hypothetical protein
MALLELHVGVQGRHQDLGHVREEVALAVAQVGIGARHRHQGGQGRERAGLTGVEGLIALLAHGHHGARRSSRFYDGGCGHLGRPRSPGLPAGVAFSYYESRPFVERVQDLAQGFLEAFV